MTVRITDHAVQRYQERYKDCTADEAREAMLTPTVILAAALTGDGQSYVRIASGHRLVIKGNAVVSFLPADHFRKQVLRHGLARFGKTSTAHRRDNDRSEG